MTEPAEPPPTMMVSYTLAFPHFVFLFEQASAACTCGHAARVRWLQANMNVRSALKDKRKNAWM
jgi:hypothetical protein